MWLLNYEKCPTRCQISIHYFLPNAVYNFFFFPDCLTFKIQCNSRFFNAYNVHNWLLEFQATYILCSIMLTTSPRNWTSSIFYSTKITHWLIPLLLQTKYDWHLSDGPRRLLETRRSSQVRKAGALPAHSPQSPVNPSMYLPPLPISPPTLLPHLPSKPTHHSFYTEYVSPLLKIL